MIHTHIHTHAHKKKKRKRNPGHVYTEHLWLTNLQPLKSSNKDHVSFFKD